MNYMQALSAAVPSGARIGTPPATRRPNISSAPPVPAQPHIEPPPYDAGMDPAWQGLLDPNDHVFRNLLNKLEPEERQVLLERAMQAMHPASPQAVSAPQSPGAI